MTIPYASRKKNIRQKKRSAYSTSVKNSKLLVVKTKRKTNKKSRKTTQEKPVESQKKQN